jgi:hypothetical protein
MKKSLFVFIGIAVCLLCTVATGMAGVPQKINFQGRLTDPKGHALDGSYDVRFRIYADSSDATVLWEESWLTTEGRPIEVSKGVFNVLLGSIDLIPDTVFTGAERWLGMKVEDDPEMRPLLEIASVGYAFHSATSETTEYALHSATSDTAEYAHNATSDGDWVIEGDNIYHEQGNVGIGTTGPGARLEVYNGNILIQGGTSGTSNKIIFKTTDNVDTSKYIGIEDYWTVLGAHGNEGWRFKDETGDVVMQINGLGANNGNVGIGTENPEAKLHVAGTPGTDGIMFPDGTIQTTAASAGGVFGNWITKSVDTVYHADTDGLVVAYCEAGSHTAHVVSLKTDASNPPMTKRQSIRLDGDNVSRLSICCPIKNGDYWEMDRENNVGSCTIYWIPLGS